jgi:hypothetical protein
MNFNRQVTAGDKLIFFADTVVIEGIVFPFEASRHWLKEFLLFDVSENSNCTGG